ncbi:MAG: hypothetical protein AAGA93_23390 [Actinomycetota bacterium]
MTDHLPDAKTFDCGDGVPDLPLLTAEAASGDPAVDQPPIGAGTMVMALVVLGQLVLLLAVLAGGNALVGAVAGAALLACGLTIVGVRNLRRTLFGD